MFTNISVAELKNLNKPKIIDIRSNQNYNNNHIPNAINVPFEKLLLYPSNYLNSSEIYYIYCQKGHASVGVCRTLSNMGYKVVNIIGGYEEWVLEN